MMQPEAFALLNHDGVALVENGVTTSYAELAALAVEYGRRLGTERRLVFLETRNSVHAVGALLGCLIGGHVVHPFAAGESHLAVARGPVFQPNVRLSFTQGECDLVWMHDRSLDLHPDLRILLSTSGSTGAPKLVKLSETNLLSNAAAIAEYLQLGPGERAATTLDFAHAFGLSVLTSHLHSGGSLLLTSRPITDPGFWTSFREGEATSFSGVPYTFELLRRTEDWASIPSLKHVAQAGGRLDPELVRHFARLGRKHGWRFQVMYGQTEASPRMAYLPPELAEDRPDCIGVAIPGGHLTLFDEQGGEISEAHVAGELIYSGPNVMMGYASSLDDLATAERLPHLRTGDLAERDTHGLFRIVGRASRFVKPFGIRVGLDDAQAIARKYVPGAVCVGDDSHIVVAVTAEGWGDPADQAAAAVATHFALPAFVVRPLVLDTMPLLPNGKVDLRAILDHDTNAGERGGPTSVKLEQGGLAERLVRRFVHEFTSIVGLRREHWDSVQAIYTTFLGERPHAADLSFRDLAGDSLSYVSTQLALEEYLGELPDNWEQMPIRDLENVRNGVHAI